MRYIIIVLLLCLVGCKAKKEVITKENREKEVSIVVERDVTLPTFNEIQINAICDTLNNKPIDFKTELRSGGITTNIAFKDNKFTAKQETPEIVEVDSSNVSKESVSKSVDKTITIVDKQWDFVFYALVIGLVIGLLKNLWIPLLKRLL